MIKHFENTSSESKSELELRKVSIDQTNYCSYALPA